MEGSDVGSEAREYDDIPGTFVFDGRRSRQGYHLNMFCMSLNDAANRDAFRADEAAYLDRFPMSPDQRQAVLDRDWNRLLELGGNVYYTFKLAACDGMTFQQLAAEQTGMSTEDYAAMMLSGGRPIDGNRSRAEWAQTQHEGSSGG
jgi:protocatechuate 4,5-dioxygenase, alpha chain